MKVTEDFFRAGTMATLKAVGEYHLRMEQQLDLLSKELEKDLREECENSGASFEEWQAEKDSLDFRLKHLFPRSLRYSFVVFLYSVVETALDALCGEIRKRRNLPDEPTQRRETYRESYRMARLMARICGNITSRKETPLERCKTFLSKNCGIDFERDPSWEKLITLEKVRNCIAHTGGLVRDSKNKNFLEQVVKRDIGISIATHPISEGRLDIEPKYCKVSIDAAIEFFTYVFERGGFGPATARILR